MLKETREPLLKRDFKRRIGTGNRELTNNLFLLRKMGLVKEVDILYDTKRQRKVKKGSVGYIIINDWDDKILSMLKKGKNKYGVPLENLCKTIDFLEGVALTRRKK